MRGMVNPQRNRRGLSVPWAASCAVLFALSQAAVGGERRKGEPAAPPAKPAVAATPAPLPSPAKPADTMVRVYPLSNADPASVAAAIETIMENEGIRVFALDSSQQLLVSGPEKGLLEVERLIQELDVANVDRGRFLQIFQLEYAEADSLGSLLSDIGIEDADLVVDQRVNSLLVTGTAQAIAEIENLIKTLDVAPAQRKPTPTSEDRKVTVFHLKNVRADNDLEQTLSILLDRGFRSLSLDADRNLVIYRGDAAGQSELKMLLESLEQAERVDPEALASPAEVAVRVRLVWLVAGSSAGDLAPPPKDLNDVIEELDKIGVADLRLAAQTVVQTVGDGIFTMQTSPILKNRCNLVISGKLQPGLPDRPRLELELSVEGLVQSGVSKPGDKLVNYDHRTLCELQTTVSAPLGHAVVLGVSPIGAMTSVFVVQISPE